MTKSEYQELVEFIAPRFDRIDNRFDAVDERFNADQLLTRVLSVATILVAIKAL